MREVAVIGAGMIPFGRREQDELMDMLASASLKALDDAGLGDGSVDAVYVANVGGGMLQHQSAIASSLADRLSLLPAAAETIENGPASGASAVKAGFLAVASGFYDTVLVVGGEKMHDISAPRATDFVAAMTHPQAEYPYGITMAGLGGMFARLYMEKYRITTQHLHAVSVKNHEMGALNPYAHIRSPVVPESVFEGPFAEINNPVIADPLRLYDLCPISDGAAALVLSTVEVAQRTGKPYVVIAGFGQATDTHTFAQREDPVELKAVTLAARAAFDMANLTPSDIHVAELHDAFTILEIAISEHIGFFRKGEGGEAVLDGRTRLGGQTPINVSGGLKARGHPLGATGVAQVAEIVWQLRHELPPERQVQNAEVGLTVNFGGFANNVLCFILKRVQS
jgi:acetyl-CoA C-acetyltransferase